MEYLAREVDSLLEELLRELPAIALEGAKGVGKTATAKRFASTTFSLDAPGAYSTVSSDPTLVKTSGGTTFVDEWQLVPQVWNVVKRAVDDGAEPGSYLLAGSASPRDDTRIHSGAGRIVSLFMRPLCFPERQVEQPSVSLSQLLAGEKPGVSGYSPVTTVQYAQEIVRSGFPGIRKASERARGLLLDGYIRKIVDRDIPEAGGTVRHPEALLDWLRAYGAATATTASYASIASAATLGEQNVPSKKTTTAYRELLQRIFVLDPIPAWIPSFSHLKRLAQAPKHHLVDPALAARLMGIGVDGLIQGEGSERFRRDGSFLGALFESLVVQTVRVLTQIGEGSVFHMRDLNGEHEVDMIVQRPDLRFLAIEAKLSTTVRPIDVQSLNWLEAMMPERIVDKVLINTGEQAYRRPDGVAVIPLALLGP
jgi:predicted AAA+ superfamily ATPase